MLMQSLSRIVSIPIAFLLCLTHPGSVWWRATNERDQRCSVVNNDKKITFTYRIHNVCDFSHAKCPYCARLWTAEGFFLQFFSSLLQT